MRSETLKYMGECEGGMGGGVMQMLMLRALTAVLPPCAPSRPGYFGIIGIAAFFANFFQVCSMHDAGAGIPAWYL